MEKTKIIETIANFIDDPYGEKPDTFADIKEITLDDAKRYLGDYRKNAEDADDAEAIAAFAEATPEMLVEAYSKYCTRLRHFLVHYKLEDYITEHELVAEYDQFCTEFLEHPTRVLPVEFLDEHDIREFPFNTKKTLTIADLIQIGVNSACLDLSKAYCYFDEDKMCIYTTDAPFHEDVIDVCAFVEFILGNADALGYLLDNVMSDEDIKSVFGCTKQEAIDGHATHYFVTILHHEDELGWDETIECASGVEAIKLIEEKLTKLRLITEFYSREVEVW